MSSWKTVHLGDICEIERGGSPRPISDFVTNDEEGINWIKITDATASGKCIYTTEEKIIPEGGKRSRMVYPGDFILSNSMSFGRPYIMKTSGCIHDGWLVLRKPNADTDFLYYILSSEVVSNQFESLAAGSTVRNLNVQIAKEVKIPLPPLAEQRKIAEILRTWDEAIETAEAELASLVRQLAGLVQSVALRIPKGKAPSGWVDRQIGELVYEAERRVEWDDNATYKLVSCARRSGGIFHREDKLGSEIAVKKMQEIRSGDFILSRMQVLHGGWAMVKLGHAGHHVSDMYMILEPRAEHLYMPYFDWISRTSWMRHLAYLSSYGVHIEKMTFVPNLFLKAKVRIPDSIAEQKRIVEMLDGFSQKVDISSVRLELLRTQKRGLMQKLLTGEVRIAA